MKPINIALKEKKDIFIYKAVKANGENFQLAYCTEFKSWIVGSKNVSIIASNKEDLDFYKYNLN